MNSSGRELAADPYLEPAFAASNRLRRAVWHFVYVVFFRLSPRPFHAWRIFLLRIFGARLGENCRIYPKSRIWAPWNLSCGDVVDVADDAILYNPSSIDIGSHAI